MEIILGIVGLVGIIAGLVGVVGPDDIKKDAQKVALVCIVLVFVIMFAFL